MKELLNIRKSMGFSVLTLIKHRGVKNMILIDKKGKLYFNEEFLELTEEEILDLELRVAG